MELPRSPRARAGVLVFCRLATATPCNADMFSQMRVTLSTEMARVEQA
jgi:hypothetical protein